MVIVLILIVLVVVLGILFLNGKGVGAVSGYNSMDEEERAIFDIGKFGQFLGKIMFGVAGSLALILLNTLLGVGWLFYAGLVCLVGVCVFALIYVNTNNRFILDDDEYEDYAGEEENGGNNDKFYDI